MAEELVKRQSYSISPAEYALLEGDLSKLNEGERVKLYNTVCSSLGLNPMTGPFGYIRLNGKLVLYAKKDCTDQLRKLHGVSVTELIGRADGGVYIVTAKGVDSDGRSDVATAAVVTDGLRGDALCNTIMKAETKAKRRLTLSICGLGMLDETEHATIPGAEVMNTRVQPPHQVSPPQRNQPLPANVDTSTGEVLDAHPSDSAADAEWATADEAERARLDAEAASAAAMLDSDFRAAKDRIKRKAAAMGASPESMLTIIQAGQKRKAVVVANTPADDDALAWNAIADSAFAIDAAKKKSGAPEQEAE